MTKAELIENIRVRGAYANECMLDRVTKKEAEAWLSAVCESVANALGEGGEVTLPDVGKLKVTARAARTGRNPQTGAEIEIPATTTVKFVTAKALKEALNG